MKKSVPIYLIHQPNETSGWQQQHLVQFMPDKIFVYVDADDPERLRKIQQAGRTIETSKVDLAQLMGENWQDDDQWAFALGFTCVGKLKNVEFCGENQQQLTDKLAVYAWARDLINQTPSQLYPEALAQHAIDYLTTIAPNAVNSRVIKGEALLQEGWVGIYNVGKGSEHSPCLVEIDYNPTGDTQAKVTSCLVGKGITFDSGGYSIKTSAGMFDMKGDMGGAAVVTGALALAIKQGLSKRVKLYLCCAENMVSDHAYKLGDILRYKNGVTVEIANTDAEGRLVLADGLIAASNDNPDLIIDAATLTGAAVMATGGDYTALFALNNDKAQHAKQVAEQVNEPLWQLPLARWHQDKCPSAFADTANSRTQPGGGAGGASNAAGFLSRFVSNPQTWLHFDLSADYNSQANSLWAAGATGQGIATIAKLVL